MSIEVDKDADDVERFLADYANNRYSDGDALVAAGRLLEYLEDQMETATYSLHTLDGQEIEFARKSTIQRDFLRSQIDRIHEWIDRHVNPDTANEASLDGTVANSIEPIRWVGPSPQASVGWLFSELSSRGFIDCSATCFYAHFVTSEGKSIKADMQSARKSEAPGNSKMRSLVSEIRKRP